MLARTPMRRHVLSGQAHGIILIDLGVPILNRYDDDLRIEGGSAQEPNSLPLFEECGSLGGAQSCAQCVAIWLAGPQPVGGGIDSRRWNETVLCIRARVANCCERLELPPPMSRDEFNACVAEEFGDVLDGECWIDTQGGGCYAGCRQVWSDWVLQCAGCAGPKKQIRCLGQADSALKRCTLRCGSDWDDQQPPDDMLDEMKRSVKRCRRGLIRRAWCSVFGCGGLQLSEI